MPDPHDTSQMELTAAECERILDDTYKVDAARVPRSWKATTIRAMQAAARRALERTGEGRVSRERILELVGEEFGPAAEGFLSETPPHDPRPRPTPPGATEGMEAEYRKRASVAQLQALINASKWHDGYAAGLECAADLAAARQASAENGAGGVG